ncbi:MAG: hypothetical protein JNL30_10010 [Rubrivivax sp.]|nr:hypothetical protein [Rubrivivax sp.]
MIRVLVLVAVVVGLALWLLKARRPRGGDDSARNGAGRPAPPAAMVACAHCGVHLPRPDAVQDAQGRSFCGEAHRLAGPR